MVRQLLFSLFVFASLLCVVAARGDDSDPIGDTTPPPQTVSSKKIQPRGKANQVAKDIQDGRLAELTDMAIGEIVRVSAIRLRTEGYKAEAKRIETEYREKYNGFLVRMVSGRNIGDHAPLMKWLADLTQMLYSKIGFSTCKLLHITDLDVINYSLPVAFHMCTFDMGGIAISRMEEVRRHLAEDPKYGGGLFPVITYWVINEACSAATFGAGWFFICGPLGSAGEYLMERFLAPGLSDKIFTGACTK